jgi:hypothetical protein
VRYLKTPFLINLIRGTAYSGRYIVGVISKVPFVIVVGEIEDSILESFLNEFYHHNHIGHFIFHRVVVLHPGSPGECIQKMLKGQFKNRLFYFAGSPLLEKDLERVQVRQANAVFILSRENTLEKRGVKDKASIIRALSIRKHSPDTPTILQILKNGSYPIALLSNPTILICIEQLKLVRNAPKTSSLSDESKQRVFWSEALKSSASLH